ncbi:MAG: HEAT repeat domain-containing protein [Gemmataceae bacterium]|nr:HEAT repeat domain-containing protein [Gemmataceae bacterium]MCI0741619.1 HEAT repeat domain-containing protein [Gemmataceae bacterium]
MGRRKKAIVGLVLAALLAGAAWWHKNNVLAWYYVNRLISADERSQEAWVKRVASLQDAALPRLLAAWGNDNPAACQAVEHAMSELFRSWNATDSRCVLLLASFSENFAAWSNAGKNAALRTAQTLLKKCPAQPTLPAPLSKAAGALLDAAEKSQETSVQRLFLAAALVERVPQGQWLDTCRSMASTGLASEQADMRAAAAYLVMRPAVREDVELMKKVMPLLKDSSAEVRRAAVLALGLARELVSDDDLLALLHNPDEDVQQHCEMALRSRGLQEHHIFLGRLMSDERPAARLQVLQHLGQARDLDANVWLRRLCQDPSPAVRAAAVRAANADLRGYLQEMAAQDSSPTVRQLASHYLNQLPR